MHEQSHRLIGNSINPGIDPKYIHEHLIYDKGEFKTIGER